MEPWHFSHLSSKSKYISESLDLEKCILWRTLNRISPRRAQEVVDRILLIACSQTSFLNCIPGSVSPAVLVLVRYLTVCLMPEWSPRFFLNPLNSSLMRNTWKQGFPRLLKITNLKITKQMSNREATSRWQAKLSKTQFTYECFNCLIPLSYHTENVESESNRGNKWLLFRGPKEDTATNLKWRLNWYQILSVWRTTWLSVYKESFVDKEEYSKAGIEDARQYESSNLHHEDPGDFNQ